MVCLVSRGRSLSPRIRTTASGLPLKGIVVKTSRVEKESELAGGSIRGTGAGIRIGAVDVDIAVAVAVAGTEAGLRAGAGVEVFVLDALMLDALVWNSFSHASRVIF